MKFEDRIGGKKLIISEICDFKEFMTNYNFFEMKVRGLYYIWFNGFVSSGIDRVLCNFYWVNEYNLIIVEFKECGILNYIFICIDIIFLSIRNRGRFRFLNVLVIYFDFLFFI